MYTLKNEYMTFAMNSHGEVCSIINGYNGHEYSVKPGEVFKLIYSEEERCERPVFGSPDLSKRHHSWHNSFLMDSIICSAVSPKEYRNASRLLALKSYFPEKPNGFTKT